jgi:hypothetical protein
MRDIKILHFIQVVNRFIYQSENIFEEFLSVLFFAVLDTRLNGEIEGWNVVPFQGMAPAVCSVKNIKTLGN